MKHFSCSHSFIHFFLSFFSFFFSSFFLPAKGNFVVVVDNEDRENEGDLLMACEAVTEEKMAFLIRHTSGLVCIATTSQRLQELELPLMVVANEESFKTAFTVSVDFTQGTTTGISAADRAVTARAIANTQAKAGDFNRPGHMFPLRAAEGGVLRRMGHTEATVGKSNFCYVLFLFFLVLPFSLIFFFLSSFFLLSFFFLSSFISPPLQTCARCLGCTQREFFVRLRWTMVKWRGEITCEDLPRSTV